MGATGLSAMIRAGAELSLEFDTIEPLACGSTALLIAGKHLCFQITLHNAEVRVAATLMDGAGPYEFLLRTADNPGGWNTVTRLCAALERNEIKSLARPIEAWDGYDGENGFVIG